MSKKSYTSEFKSTIVELQESGKTPTELTQEYGVSLASVNRWKKEFSPKALCFLIHCACCTS